MTSVSITEQKNTVEVLNDSVQTVQVTSAGPQGIQGLTGPQGNQGETGPQGIQGDTGSQGSQGETGPQGIQGETGAQGIQGIQGETGPAGVDGADGSQADWNATSGTAEILNKPTIPSNNNQLTNGAGFITSTTASVASSSTGMRKITISTAAPDNADGSDGDLFFRYTA